MIKIFQISFKLTGKFWTVENVLKSLNSGLSNPLRKGELQPSPHLFLSEKLCLIKGELLEFLAWKFPIYKMHFRLIFKSSCPKNVVPLYLQTHSFKCEPEFL